MLAQEIEWIRAVVGLGFKVIRREVKPSVDGQETVMSLTAVCIEEEAGELLAFPLLYALASLSFYEARPYGGSERHYSVDDHLSLREFFQTLSYEQGCLLWYGDYIKGRRVKTELRLTPQGEFTIYTVGRGLGPDFWLRILRGEKPLQVLPFGLSNPKRRKG